MHISIISIADTTDESYDGNHSVTITGAADDRVRAHPNSQRIGVTGASLVGPFVSVAFHNDEGTRAMLRNVLAEMGTVMPAPAAEPAPTAPREVK